jgi:hypothetical protein
MRLLAALFLALVCCGCSAGNRPPDPAQKVTITLTTPEAKRVTRIRELKRPAHVARVDELLTKLETMESRESAWSRNLMILGAGLGVLAVAGIALKVLGAL